MIKVGIAGADTKTAGEILRLCLHHPDVDVVTAYAPAHAGKSLSEVHHGFIGESRMNFSAAFDATALDVAFIMCPVYSDSDWAKLMADRPELRLIIFPGAEKVADALPRTPVYGLSEIYRKAMVRGAREAIVPDSVASPVLVALYPLASHLLLNGDIDVSLSAPADLITPDRLKTSAAEIKRELSVIQSSFSGKVNLTAQDSGAPRSMTIKIRIRATVSVAEILKVYNSIYDDHNFTFVVTSSVTPEDVEATDRIIVSVTRLSSDELGLTVVADPRMRGGAGEAVHIMNLFLGLHEKTGLDLKTSSWK